MSASGRPVTTTAARLAAYVAEAIKTAPPLSREQADKIGALWCGATPKQRTP